eukprot:4350292-Pleurochrysis_carterae.AAC.2
MSPGERGRDTRGRENTRKRSSENESWGVEWKGRVRERKQRGLSRTCTPYLHRPLLTEPLNSSSSSACSF